jgi:hypothetical protein
MGFIGDNSRMLARPTPSKSRTSLARVRTGAAIAVGIAVAVMLVTGISAAAPASAASSSKFSAPYAGYAYGFGVTYSSGCKVAGSMPVAPNFDTATGVGVEWVKVRAGSCGSANSSYTINAFTGIESNNLTPLGGLHNLTIHVTLSFIANMSANGPGAAAYFLVDPELVLFDLTNGSTFFGSAGGITDQIAVGSYYHEFSHVKFLGFLDFDFKRSHVYQWEVNFVVLVSASTFATSSSALAGVNMGTQGQRAVLDSVVIH